MVTTANATTRRLMERVFMESLRGREGMKSLVPTERAVEMNAGVMFSPAGSAREEHARMLGQLEDRPDAGAGLRGGSNGLGALLRDFHAQRNLVAEVMSERQSGLPEVAMAFLRIDEISAASEHTRPTGKILSQPERKQEPRLPTILQARGRQDHARKDRGREPSRLVFEKAVLDPDLDVADSTTPAFAGSVGEAQGQRRGELNALHRAEIEIGARVRVEHRLEALALGEGVDLPVAGVS